MTFVLFWLWNLIAFGPGVLQIEYLLLLLEPLMLYTGGLGAWPIEWLGGYHWLYNIVSPGSRWPASAGSRRRRGDQRRRVRAPISPRSR